MPITELAKPRFLKAYRNINIIALTEAVAQNELSKSVRINVDGLTGYISKLNFIYWKRGTGTVRTPQLTVYLFREDPLLTNGETDLEFGENEEEADKLLGEISIASSDWTSITSTASVTKTVLFAFELLTPHIWVALRNLDADTIVGDATNGEAITLLDMTVEYLP